MIHILIVPLTSNPKQSLFYQLQQSVMVSLEPLALDSFPNKILEWAKDPIIGISEVYVELLEYLYDGSMDTFYDMLPEEIQLHLKTVDKDKGVSIFKEAGKEMANIIDEIVHEFHYYQENLDDYQSAEFVFNGIAICKNTYPLFY